MTKFQNVGEKNEYEIAQQPILAFRASGSSPLPEPGEFQVICGKTVRLMSLAWMHTSTSRQEFPVKYVGLTVTGEPAAIPYHSDRPHLYDPIR